MDYQTCITFSIIIKEEQQYADTVQTVVQIH